ncbi:hypothetical protein AAY473_022508 [Plecturocebus cupreus]
MQDEKRGPGPNWHSPLRSKNMSFREMKKKTQPGASEILSQKKKKEEKVEEEEELRNLVLQIQQLQGFQELETSLSNKERSHLLKNLKITQVWWCVPVVPATQEAEHFGRPRRADHHRSGVRDQPGQHDETPSLLKVQKLARSDWTLTLAMSLLSPCVPTPSLQFSCFNLLSSWNCIQTNATTPIETRFCHVGQTGLKFLTSSDPPASVSQSAGITDVSHYYEVFKDLDHTTTTFVSTARSLVLNIEGA